MIRMELVRRPIARAAVVLLFSAGWCGAQSTASEKVAARDADPWAPFRHLEGSWTGTVQGTCGDATVERRYEFVMNGRFLYERNKSTFAPQEKNPKGETHEDWGMFSFDGDRNKIVLRQFHIEGFVHQYALDSRSPDGKKLVFVTERIENIGPGWRARQTYELRGHDALVETHELAAPGKEFKVFFKVRLERKTGGGASSPT